MPLTSSSLALFKANQLKTSGALLLALGGAFLSTPAQATDKEVCVESHATAQELRQRGRLLEAREKLLVCAQSTCPVMVRSDCAPWLQEVEAAAPSVVIEAKDSSGQQTNAVRVWIDQVLVTEKLDGRALPVDPGEHAFVFAHESGVVQEGRITVREGEKMRSIQVAFAPVPKPEPPQTSLHPAVLPGAFGGAGLLAFGTSAYFGLKALSDRNALTCAPYCSDNDVSSVRAELRAANIALGVGVVLSGVAAWLFFSHLGEPASKPLAQPTGAPRLLAFDRTYAAESACPR